MKPSPSYTETMKRRLSSTSCQVSPRTRRLQARSRSRDVCSDDEAHKGKDDGGGSDGEGWGSSDSDTEMATLHSAKPSPKTSVQLVTGAVVAAADAAAASINPTGGAVPLHRSTTSEEENTSDRSMCGTNGRGMVSSGSTMNSSLERSLEMAALHSDGLSDKERQIRHVKNLICARNPQTASQLYRMDETSGSESEELAVV